MTAFMVANIKVVLLFALVGVLATLSELGRREASRTTAKRSPQALSA